MTNRLPCLSVRGEEMLSGPWAGSRCIVVPFSGCGAACPGCRSSAAYERKHLDRMTGDIVGMLPKKPKRVLLGGTGEPLMWRDSPAFADLMAYLDKCDAEVMIETGGRIAHSEYSCAGFGVSHFRVAPLIGPALAAVAYDGPGVDCKAIRGWRKLAQAGRAHFSFVASSEIGVYDVAAFAEAHEIPAATVWVQAVPPGRSGVLKKKIDDLTARLGFQVARRPKPLPKGPIPPEQRSGGVDAVRSAAT